jgi:drug/metabolite transporter (DMT)-like permease
LDILLGIAAAVAWGISDFSARFASRRVGAYRTLMLMQPFGVFAVTIYLLRSSELAHVAQLGRKAWLFAIIAGLVNTVASLALYRSFEIGTMSIVAPVSSAYPALTLALALLSGEHIRALRFVGLAVTFIGVLLAATSLSANAQPSPQNRARESTARISAGAGWAIAAAIGFGFMFWWLGFHVVPLVGAATSVWIVRITSLLALLAVGVPTARALPLPRGGVWWLLLVVGLMDTCAFVMNNIGLSMGHVAVVSMLSSLYGAVAVLLSWIFLRERMERTQWLGIFLIFAGIVLVSL